MFTSIVRARDQYLALPPLKFEAVTFGIALLVGLLIMPAFIYLAGILTLQDYAHGGVFALYFDFFKGLVQLRSSFWFVTLGPYLFLSVFRLFRWLLRKT